MNDMESNEFYRFAKSLGVDSNFTQTTTNICVI